MTLESLQQFIDEQDALFRSLHIGGETDKERIFTRTIKLGEEYGELCDEILSSLGDQRKSKLEEQHDLEGEFADVVIVTLLLAKSMNIDISSALERKIQKIKEKHNKELRN